ncbi:hypothetical protein CXF72_06275 [Psychromonas sp. MB-3u-54]|nr:hypothetical protein CXF72_06275 [Psychromonas sp. MB-3u-54]
MLITSVFIFYFGQISLTQFFINLTMLQQFFGVPHIDGSYWTLTNEIIFYGFIFLLISLNLFQHINRILAVLLFFSLFFWLYVTKTGTQPPVIGTLFLLKYIPYFASGAIFFSCYRDGWNVEKISYHYLFFVLFSLFLIAMLCTEDLLME